jgi:hypothetical protein
MKNLSSYMSLALAFAVGAGLLVRAEAQTMMASPQPAAASPAAMASCPPASATQHEHGSPSSGAMGSGSMGMGNGGMMAMMCGMMSPGMSPSAADMDYMHAMMQMHQSMKSGHHLTGNADLDFTQMMILHYQAAIAMEKTEIQDGKDPKVRAFAESAIKDQEAAIAQMQALLK